MEIDTIQKGDCLEKMKELPDNCVDLVIMDPPYQIVGGGKGGAFGDEARNYHGPIRELSDGITDDVLREVVRVMKKINIYIWCNKNQFRQYINFFEDLGCVTDILTWHKTNPIPTGNNKYLSDTEYILFFREKGVGLFGNYHTKKKYYVTQTNKEDKDKYGHPTIKPLFILENLIINSSHEGDLILDPFMGSGSTAVASLNQNRHFIGYEIDDTYFNIAIQRVAEAKDEIRSKNFFKSITNKIENSKQ